MRELREYLIRLPRPWKRLFMVAVDTIGAVSGLILAIWLQGLPLSSGVQPWWQLPLVVGSVTTACAYFGLYSTVIRYIALRAAFQIAFAVVTAVVALAVVGLLTQVPALQPLVLFNFGLLLLLSIGAARVLARHFLTQTSDPDAERLLIYGAGEAGVQVAQSLETDRRRRVVGFIDDRRELVGKKLADLPVFPSSKLPRLIERKRISSVLLALPSASRRRKQELIDRIEPLPVTVKTVPSLQEILSGRAQISEIRDIDIEDLLGRDTVPPDQALLTRSISAHVVMVTGAGGSIGSELCRQIVRLEPSHLVLLESNEYSLYRIEREVRALAKQVGHVRVTPVLGDVLDRELVRTCIRNFGIQTLFHAAAYKHVPLVEHNVRAGLRNNIFGTCNIAKAALECGVERFILISTDKAVRPTSVMGATKRVAELVVQAMAQRAASSNGSGPRCIFSMVRFGNVLDSSGSVVPHFREQIHAGGPVTVTHPDITRFFMTIPEAAQLVIQAGAMAQGGEVFVLDMGKPIRIVDLAKRMIRLAGYTLRDPGRPDGDIEIEFTGLRPGEKLYEELLIDGSTVPSGHPKIGFAQDAAMSWEQLELLVQKMHEATVQDYRRAVVMRLLQQAVPEYTAADEHYDLIGIEEDEERFETEDELVVLPESEPAPGFPSA